MSNGKPAEAAPEWRDAADALLERLQDTFRADDEPRWKYVQAIGELVRYLHAIGAAHDVTDYFSRLAVALCDLEGGVVNPLFAPVKRGKRTKGRSPDPTDTWHLRMWVALGMECLRQSGLNQKDAVEAAVTRWPGLRRLDNLDKAHSIWSWHDRLMRDKIDNGSVLKAFKRLYAELGIGGVSAAEHDQLARLCFTRAEELLDAATK